MSSPSVIEYFILALLLSAALAALVLGLRRYGRRIGQGRAGPPPAAGRSFAGRAFNAHSFVRRALLAERLWKRPVAGLAHALLLGGAVVAIVGHASFALSFVGVDVYAGWFGTVVMRWARELAGLAMLSGAAFFLLRRLGRLPRLVEGGERKGFVAMEVLLLLTVVAGFVAEAFRLATLPAAPAGEFVGSALAAGLAGLDAASLAWGETLMWWGHGLLGVSFIALIAYTPLSHMLLGPANSALARPRPGIQLAPIDFDADEDSLRLGATRLSELPRKSLLDLSACLGCGRCQEVCPAAQTGKALSPKKVMLTCAEYLEQGRADDAQLIDEVGSEAIFDCTTCAACVEECPVSNSPAEIILEFRRNLVMDRSEMPDTLALANRNLEARGHPFAGTSANPDDWCKGLDIPLFEAGKTEYLLWLGCAVTYEERAQEVARAMVRILEAAGVSYGVLGEARCTGDPAKMAGNEIQFVDMAQDNIEAFGERGIRKVITMCAHCFNSFDRYYPELGADWVTIPHSVLIEELIAQGRLQVARDDAELITFHDPCYLARHNDIVEEPRKVLSALGTLIEMPRSRKDSMCCGAGGCNYWSAGNSGSARINDVRTREALDTGAGKIATSCSFCLLMLGSSASREGPERKVFDVAELVAERILPAAGR
ncbi:(Fe-S)-binding protein [Thauera butanivorans]|uniref:(Fe-S)-binding protein n=1 Tax=Thauera butanivorans TaxID=86174 RepID=UPI000AAFB09A|nr:(Fe-S)-binding protein [Thauera butanivorans]